MRDYSNLAQKLSRLYPPITLPADKKQWNTGHKCIAEFDRVNPRCKLLIPSLAWNFFWSAWLKRKAGVLPNSATKRFMDYLIAESYPEEISFFKRRLLCFKLNCQSLQEIFSGLISQTKTRVIKADSEIAKMRKKGVHPIEMIQKYHIGNCGELASYAGALLKIYHTPSVKIVMRLSNKDGSLQEKNDHAFVLFRTDNEPLTFRSAMSDLYHPNMRVLDLWLGKCLPPEEIFNEYTRIFFDENIIQDEGKSISVKSLLKKGTGFVLSPENDKSPLKYIVGHVTGETSVFGKEYSNSFAKVPPHLYRKYVTQPLILPKNKENGR